MSVPCAVTFRPREFSHRIQSSRVPCRRYFDHCSLMSSKIPMVTQNPEGCVISDNDPCHVFEKKATCEKPCGCQAASDFSQIACSRYGVNSIGISSGFHQDFMNSIRISAGFRRDLRRNKRYFSSISAVFTEKQAVFRRYKAEYAADVGEIAAVTHHGCRARPWAFFGEAPHFGRATPIKP